MDREVGDGDSNSRCSHSLQSKPTSTELVNSFEKILSGRLDELNPKNSDFLNLAWMRQAMEVLSKTYEDVEILIGDLEIKGRDCVRGRWITKYMIDSLKILQVCHGLSADISKLDYNQFMLIHSVYSLLNFTSGRSTVPQQDIWGQAKISLQEWIEGTNPGFQNRLGILQALSRDLELQMGWRSRGSSSLDKDKGKAVFLRAMSGVKAMVIFICSVISCALSSLSGDQQGLQGRPLVEVQVPSHLLWSASFMSLQKLVNEEMIRTRNKFLLSEWISLDRARHQLYGVLDRISAPPPGQGNSSRKEIEEQQDKKDAVRQGVEELRQSSMVVREGVFLLTDELNDILRVVSNVNTALLDKVKLSPQPKILDIQLLRLKMKIKIRKPKIKLKAVVSRISAASCFRIRETP